MRSPKTLHRIILLKENGNLSLIKKLVTQEEVFVKFNFANLKSFVEFIILVEELQIYFSTEKIVFIEYSV